jgi:hypothetical protein
VTEPALLTCDRKLLIYNSLFLMLCTILHCNPLILGCHVKRAGGGARGYLSKCENMTSDDDRMEAAATCSTVLFRISEGDDVRSSDDPRGHSNPELLAHLTLLEQAAALKARENSTPECDLRRISEARYKIRSLE